MRWLYGVCCQLGLWQYDEGFTLDIGEGQNSLPLSLTTLSEQNLQTGGIENTIGLQLLLASGCLAQFIFHPLRQSTKTTTDLPQEKLICSLG